MVDVKSSLRLMGKDRYYDNCDASYLSIFLIIVSHTDACGFIYLAVSCKVYF